MSRFIYLLSAALLANTSCKPAITTSDGELTPPKIHEISHTIDQESGQLIAFWLLRHGEYEAVIVDHPYAIFISWPCDTYPAEGDAPVLIFYDNVLKVCYRTDDYESFLTLLKNQPADIPIAWIDSCTVSRAWKMPEDKCKAIHSVLSSSGRRQPESVYGVCICESDMVFKYPGDQP